MYIYKIENEKNGMIYIGKTNDFNRRIGEHFGCSKSFDKNHLTADIKLYGKECFKYSIIKELESNESSEDIERYYIELYSKTHKMYNFSKGVIGKETAHKIAEILKSNNCQTFSEIGDLFLASRYVVRDINIGANYRFDEDFDYPIRSAKWIEVRDFLEKNILDIYDLILNSNLTFKEIADRYNTTITTVANINNGDMHREYKKEEYPLRKFALKGDVVNIDIFKSIIEDIKESDESLASIDRKYSLSRGVTSAYNVGATRKKVILDLFPNIVFPIRKSIANTNSNITKGRNYIKLNIRQLKELYDDLKNTKQTMKSLSEKYKLSAAVISNINNGKTKTYVNILSEIGITDYPIRKK